MMNDHPKDADVSNDTDDGDQGDRTIDTTVNLEDITVIDLEHILADLEKENPEPDPAALQSRKRLEDLLEEKRAKEALSDFDDYGIDDEPQPD